MFFLFLGFFLVFFQYIEDYIWFYIDFKLVILSFDFLILFSIYRIVLFYLFSFFKFCLIFYMIFQVYVNRKLNQQNKKKKKQVKLMKIYVVFYLFKLCFFQNQLKVNRGWFIIRVYFIVKLVYSIYGELYQLCFRFQFIVLQMFVMILLRVCIF